MAVHSNNCKRVPGWHDPVCDVCVTLHQRDLRMCEFCGEVFDLLDGGLMHDDPSATDGQGTLPCCEPCYDNSGKDMRL